MDSVVSGRTPLDVLALAYPHVATLGFACFGRTTIAGFFSAAFLG
jgi:hypothetical protein